MNCPKSEIRLSYGTHNYWPTFSERRSCSEGAFYHCRELQANKQLMEAVHAISVVCAYVPAVFVVATVQCNPAWVANLPRFFHVILPLLQQFTFDVLHCVNLL